MLEDLSLHGESSIPEPEDTPDISGMSLRDQLAFRMKQASQLYEAIQHDDEVPANQKTQVLNTIVSIISQLTKLETDMHSVEQVKRLERALISTLKRMPEELQQGFFKEYEAELAKSAG